MSEPQQLLIPFSGQQDAIDLGVQCATSHPDAEIVLLYVKNIGFRPSFEPPVITARALAERFPRVARLIVCDARLLQQRGLLDLPTDFSRQLGVRSFCTVCQSSLLLVSALVSHRLGATLVLGAREGLGADLDDTLRALARAVATSTQTATVAMPHAEPSGLRLPVLQSQRCALAKHHRDPDLLEGTEQQRLASWLSGWAAGVVDAAHLDIEELIAYQDISLRAC